jgi:DNA-binding MarR family transcriptional regulator
MKKSFTLLAELLPLIDAYEKATAKPDVQGFLQFSMQQKEVQPKISLDKEMQMKANQMGFYLNYLFRFLKVYTKTALRNSAISTIDDFIFLASLSREESMRKTDLIKNNMMEIPSGMEVIKRLMKAKLVKEFADADDKRSMRLSMTEKGRKELFVIFGEMNKVGNVLVGNLKKEEVNQMHGLLEKLFAHHQTIRDIDISEGLESLLKPR